MVTAPKLNSHSRERLAILPALACLLCLSLSARQITAQLPRCTPAEKDRLETQAATIRSWSALQSFFHRYTRCGTEDADVETSVGEFVARTLTKHWETLSTAARLFRDDPDFEKFALAGINSTELTEDLQRIDTLAATQCPANLHGLCHKIRKAVRENK